MVESDIFNSIMEKLFPSKPTEWEIRENASP